MNDYKAAAEGAKLKFCAKLKGLIDRGRYTKTEIGELSGMGLQAVSRATSDRPITSEQFIRMVSITVEGMETAYQEFRAEVDWPYLPKGKPDNKLQEEREAKDALLSQLEDMFSQLRRIL